MTTRLKSFFAHRRPVMILVVTCLLLFALVGRSHSKGEGKVSAEDNGLRVSLRLFGLETKPKVGNPVRATVRITNLTEKLLAVPKGKRTEHVSDYYLSYAQEIRIEPRKDGMLSSGPIRMGGGYAPIRESDLIFLQPGETKEYHISVVPKVPGEVALLVRMVNSTTYGKKLPGDAIVWKGKITLYTGQINVLPEDTKETDKKASNLAKILLNEEASFLERAKLLEKEIIYRTSSDALALSKALEKVPKTSPIRFIVVNELVKMVSEGYGYVAIKKIFDIAQGPSELPNVRLCALDVANLVRENNSLQIDTGHNLTTFGIHDGLKNEGKAVLTACAGSEDKAVSARAKYLLGELSENEKKRKEKENHGKLKKESKTAPEEGNGEDSSTAEPAVKEKPKPIEKPKAKIEPIQQQAEPSREWLVICLIVVIIVQAGLVLFLLLRRGK